MKKEMKIIVCKCGNYWDSKFYGRYCWKCGVDHSL